MSLTLNRSDYLRYFLLLNRTIWMKANFSSITFKAACWTMILPKQKTHGSKLSVNFDFRNFSERRSRYEVDFSDLSALNKTDSSENKKKHKGKTPIVPKVYVRDEKGRLLGLMTLPEAQKLAQKYKKILVETDGPAKKIPTMKFSDPRIEPKHQQQQSEDSSEISEDRSSLETSDKSRKKAAPKVIAFTTKVSEHDLQVKINQVKKFLLKGQETLVRVSSPNPHDIQQLETIFQKFDTVFNESNGVRINQKRIKGADLKFNILVIDLETIKQKLSFDQNMEKDEFIPMDQIDPNKLLEDETIIDKIKEETSKK